MLHASFGLTQYDAMNAVYASCKNRADLVQQGEMLLTQTQLKSFTSYAGGKKILRCNRRQEAITKGYGCITRD